MALVYYCKLDFIAKRAPSALLSLHEDQQVEICIKRGNNECEKTDTPMIEIIKAKAIKLLACNNNQSSEEDLELVLGC